MFREQVGFVWAGSQRLETYAATAAMTRLLWYQPADAHCVAEPPAQGQLQTQHGLEVLNKPQVTPGTPKPVIRHCRHCSAAPASFATPTTAQRLWKEP